MQVLGTLVRRVRIALYLEMLSFLCLPVFVKHSRYTLVRVQMYVHDELFEMTFMSCLPCSNTFKYHTHVVS